MTDFSLLEDVLTEMGRLAWGRRSQAHLALMAACLRQLRSALFGKRRSLLSPEPHAARVLSEKGVDAFNGPQGRILFVLWQKDGVPMSELSRQTGLATTSLTSMIDRMEASGLVRRERTVADRRKVLIYLTDEARALEQDYNEVSDEMNAIFYEGFSEEEAERLDGYLNKQKNSGTKERRPLCRSC